jgi:hypothetical protein
MPRQTIYGLLTGVHKDANGNWIMTVKTESGEFKDYPHDGFNAPLTENTKRKTK